MRSLADYERKRNFAATPEPKGRPKKSPLPIFVVQRHAARRLHYDFRLEVNGALASWAVPKGPPEERGEKRLAVHVEDHPIDYAKFEGEIPKGNYGAGQVQIWDKGTYEVEGPEPAAAQIERGDFKFRLHGERLNGRFVLVKMRRSDRGNEWLLIRKESDAAPSTAPHAGKSPTSSGKVSEATRKAILNPEELSGAKKTAMPDKIPVALATLADKPFSNPDWLFEIKWDGERAVSFVRDGEVELRSRSGREITQEYPELKELPRRLNARKAILDGEVVVLDEAGRSDFMRIQQRFGVLNPSVRLQQTVPVTYYAFDLLYYDGYDLRNVALETRKELLRSLLTPSERVRFSDHQIEKGIDLYEAAKQLGLEGIIAKRRDSIYPGKRSSLWLKFKIVRDIDVVIGGWTAPRKSREHFGALLMGLYDADGNLEYIGSVGTGFTQDLLDSIYKTLQGLHTRDCPFRAEPKLKEAVYWVKPELVARVKFGQWTHDKKLRAPVFLGFQEDRAASDCRFDNQVTAEVAAPAGASVADTSKRDPSTASRAAHTPREEKQRGTPLRMTARGRRGEANARAAKAQSSASSTEEVAVRDLEKELASGRGESLAVDLNGKRVNLTHLNKIYFPEDGLRKRDVLLYYLRVAPHILPFLKDRPLVLKRYPNGIDEQFFFQKEATSAPDWIRTVQIDSKERGGKMPYFLADDRADLLYLTNLGCIDHNPWSSRFDDQDHPDYVFVDLDPTDGTSFDVVLKVARAIHKQLESLKVRVYMKTSGASGFHMYIPLEPEYTYEEVRLFAGAIGQRVQAELPSLVTSERTVSKRRKGTVLIDALQNAKGKPLASVYSLRPFRGAPFSAPVSPRELAKGFEPKQFNIETILGRLKRPGDLWEDFWDNRQRLQDVVKRAT
ncbi:MAG TPA: DNA ligase D [Candidatus Acidoferrales bacterium]|nr:DNA ligase D [Candidatus Acidoferrales bacterium]